MAISVVAVSSQTVYTTTGAKSQSYPYTPVAGDVVVHYQGGRWTRSLAPNGFQPTGFTLLTSHYRSATPDVVGAAWYKVLDGSETSIDFTIGASANPVGTITIILRGVDNTNVVVSSAVQNAGAATTFQMNSHTTTVVDEFCLRMVTSSASNGNLSLSTVNSWTTHASGSAYDATGVSQHVHSRSIATSGSASNLTVTSGASGAWVGLRVSFRSSTVISGSAAVSQAADAGAASGSSALSSSGTVAVTETDDTGSASGGQTFSGTVAVTEADDTSTASGALSISGSAAPSQTADTSTASGVEVFTGTVAVTEADDTSSAVSTLTISGTVATTQDAQSGVASGELVLSGSAAVAQVGDTAAVSGAVELIGSASPTQDDDVAAASGSVVAIEGSVAVTQADDSASVSAELVLEGAAASTQGDDVASAFGELIISGAVAAVADDDTATAAGALVISGSSAIVQASDTVLGTVLAGRTRVFDVGLVAWRAGHVKRWDGSAWVEDFRVKVWDPGVSAWVSM